MAAPSQTSYNSSTGNGVTTVFPYTFKILQDADLQVLVDGVEQTLTTHYTVSGVGVDGGGNVTFVTAPANGTTVVRRRDMALERTGTDYQYQGEIPADVLNDDQDAPILMLQQLQEQINRAFRLPAGETMAEFDAADDRADLLPIFNTTTGVPELSDFTATQIRDMIANGYGSGALGVSGYIATLLDDADAAAARTTLAAAGSGAVTASGLTMTTARMLGRTTAGTGAPEELTAGAVATLLASSPALINGTIVHSRAGSAETIAIKTLAGADPSAADPVGIVFRNATGGTGDYTVLTLTAATSITISSGSTMGASNGTAFRLWLVAFNDAGTVRLGVIKCQAATGIYPLAAWGIASSTAEGGAGAADSSQVFYTGTAVSSKPYSVLGYSTWEAGLATAGTWGTAPSRVQIYGPGVKLPMDRLQCVINSTGGGLASSSTSYVDITNATLSITLTSAANAVLVRARGSLSSPYNGGANTGGSVQLLEGATVIDGNYLHAGTGGATGVGWDGPINQQALRFPNSASALTYKLQQKARNAGAAETITTSACNLYAEELMT